MAMSSLLSAWRREGAPAALLSALLFGASMPVAKLLLGTLSPWMLAGLLYLGSGLGLGVARLGARLAARPSSEAPLGKADFPWLAAVVLIGGLLAPVLLMAGLARTEAAVAALLLNLEGLSTMAIAWLVFHENVDRRIFLGAMTILAGAVLLSSDGGWSGDGREGAGWGAVLIASACVAWGIDNNLTRKLSFADPVQVAMVKGLAAGAANIVLALSQGAATPSTAMAIGAGAVGFLGYGVSIALFVLALRRLGAARTSAYFSTAPFIGAALSVAMFGEPLTARLIAAAGLMAFGVYLHLVERHGHRHEHEPTVHEHLHWHDEHHHHDHGPDHPPGEPHSHLHRHERLAHDHEHYPDLHHRHGHC